MAAPQQTIQVDKLLQTVVNQKASDLHITSGQPPVLRVGGHMVRLETKSLEAEDCVSLMKSITPERNQQELQERGGPTSVLRSASRPAFASPCSNSAGTSASCAGEFLTSF